MSDEALWDVSDLATYLKRSRRWVLARLRLASDAPGSIPHVKLRTGERGDPEARFSPSVVRAWLEAGMPAAEKMGRALGEDIDDSGVLGTKEDYQTPPTKAT